MSTNQQSDTPRTNARAKRVAGPNAWDPQDAEAVHSSFARELERELTEARDWVRRLHKETQVLTCAFCGRAYPPNTPDSGSEVLTAHILVCEKHPMRKAEARIEELRAKCAKLEADQARLDWLENNRTAGVGADGPNIRIVGLSGGGFSESWSEWRAPTVRAAIDAAMAISPRQPEDEVGA